MTPAVTNPREERGKNSKLRIRSTFRVPPGVLRSAIRVPINSVTDKAQDNSVHDPSVSIPLSAICAPSKHSLRGASLVSIPFCTRILCYPSIRVYRFAMKVVIVSRKARRNIVFL